MKKELIKSYLEWPKLASFDTLKNRIAIITKDSYHSPYSIYVKTNPGTIPGWIFNRPYYKQRIFINLYGQIKIFDTTNKLQAGSVFVHRYFISV